MNNKKYRIKELNNKFTIEVYGYIRVPHLLFFTKKEWGWYRANSYGGIRG